MLSTRLRIAPWLRCVVEMYPRLVTQGEITMSGTRKPHSFGSSLLLLPLIFGWNGHGLA